MLPRSALASLPGEKAGNDSEPKHSCGPDDRPICVWVEIAIGSVSPALPPPSIAPSLPSLNFLANVHTREYCSREKETANSV